MNANLITVICTLVSAIIAFLVYALQKRIRYQYDIKYSILEYSRVLGKLPSNYQTISLNYKDYSVDNNLQYVRGIIFNTRSADVSCDEEKGDNVYLNLPEGCKWIDVRIKGESQGVCGKVNIKPERAESAEMSFSLIKKGEGVIFEGLVEASGNNPQISIQHRVKNLGKIKRYTVLSKENRNNYRWALPICFFFILFYSFLPVIENLKMKGFPIMYENIYSGEKYYAGINRDGMISISERSLPSWNSKIRDISLSTFTEQYKPNYSYVRNKTGKITVFCLVCFFDIFIFFILLSCIRELYWSRIINTIQSHTQEPS